MRIARVAGSALHGHCLVHSENARIGEADRLRLFLYDDATTAMVVGMDKGAGAQRLTIDVRRETRAETRRRETMRQCGFANVSSSHVSARLASIVSRPRAHAYSASGGACAVQPTARPEGSPHPAATERGPPCAAATDKKVVATREPSLVATRFPQPFRCVRRRLPSRCGRSRA